MPFRFASLIAPARRAARRRSRGQALAEFAIVLPLVVLLLVIAIDFGRVFFGWVSINNAARVGASYAAANADAWEAPGDASRRARYVALVENDLQALNCNFPGVPNPAFTDADGSGTLDTGEPVEVTLQCAFDLVTPLGTSIVGQVDLGGASTFPVHYTITTALPPPPPPPPVPTCTVPDTVGESRNTARTLWDDASFQPANLIEQGNGNFTVDSQSVPANTEHPCTGSMTISEAASPSPTCDEPTANFSATPVSGRSPLLVQFTDLSTAAPSCPILAWSWSFGDGETSTTEDPSHSYTHSGGPQTARFRVSLTVTTAGGSDTESKNNYIQVSR